MCDKKVGSWDSTMAGIIYCFNTLSSKLIYKAGHTQQSFATRCRGYTGPSRPRSVIFAKPVDNSVLAERYMLSLIRQCVSLQPRRDMGTEWFEATDVSVEEERHSHLLTIADIVQKAVQTTGMASGGQLPKNILREQNVSVDPFRSCILATSIEGLGEYFEGLDEYVRSQDELHFASASHLLSAYESSTTCPVLVDYLPCSSIQRANVVHNRYSRLFVQ